MGEREREVRREEGGGEGGGREREGVGHKPQHALRK